MRSHKKSATTDIHFYQTKETITALLYRGSSLWQFAKSDSSALYGSFFCGRIVTQISTDNYLVDIGRENTGLLEAPKTHFSEGQKVLVQCDREEILSKGIGLTLSYSIPGRYSVFMTAQQKNNLESNKYKDKPKEWYGVLRSIASEVERSYVLNEMQRQVDLYRHIEKEWQSAQKPALLYQSPDTVQQMLMDADQNTCLRVHSREVLRKVQTWCASLYPDLSSHVEVMIESDRFQHEAVEDAQHEAALSKIRLLSGAEIIIEPTQALTVIDVDQSSSALDAFGINSEAAAEAARQIVLKNIGGIIAIDFLRMKSDKQRKAIETQMQSFLSVDPLPHRMIGFSKLGLMEITRARRGIVYGAVGAIDERP